MSNDFNPIREELRKGQERRFRYDGRPYEGLTDLDIVTIASSLVGSLEYYAMLTVVQGRVGRA